MLMVGSSVAVLGALRDLPVFAGQALRFVVAAALLLVVLRLRTRRCGPGPRPTARQWGRITALAAVGMVGFNVAVVAAEHYADPALVGVVVGGAPIVIAIVGPLLARTAPQSRIVLAGVVVVVGTGIAHGLGSGTSALGLLLAAAALAAEVAFALVATPLLASLGALRVSTLACVVAVPVCLTGMLVTGEAALPDAGELAAVLWLGVVVTAVAYVFWFTAVGSIGPERAGLFTSLVPISAVGVTALLGTGSPTWAHAAGATVVLVGLLLGLSRRRDRTAPGPVAPAGVRPTPGAVQTADDHRAVPGHPG